MTTLKLVKITQKQISMIADLLIYFNGRYERAIRITNNNANFVEKVPLQKIYNQFKCNSKDKEAVKIAANVFFSQETRGCFKSGKCSGWRVRMTPKINNQVFNILNQLHEQNKEHISNVRTYLNTPKEKLSEIVSVTTEFKFKSVEQAQVFGGLIETTLCSNQEEELPNGYTVPTKSGKKQRLIPQFDVRCVTQEQRKRWEQFHNKAAPFYVWRSRMKQSGKYISDEQFWEFGYDL